MDTPIPTNPIDALLPAISQAVADWQAKHTPKELTQRVNKLLNDSCEEIIIKLLGFNKDSRDGRWSLDHCNGRSGESAAGDYLRQAQADAIREWLAKIPMPTMSTKMLSDFKKQYETEFNSRVKYQMRRLIEQEADKRAEQLFDELTQSNQVNDFIKVMQLISPKGITHAG